MTQEWSMNAIIEHIGFYVMSFPAHDFVFLWTSLTISTGSAANLNRVLNWYKFVHLKDPSAFMFHKRHSMGYKMLQFLITFYSCTSKFNHKLSNNVTLFRFDPVCTAVELRNVILFFRFKRKKTETKIGTRFLVNIK